MKKIPYGVTDYKELIEDGCYYIDKTMYLEKLEDITNKKLVYFRPRRFGKTMLTSMMYYYYDINSRNLFDMLFKDTYIYNNPTVNKNNYYVLKFDFLGMSSINTADINKIEKQFNFKAMYAIKEFISYYNLDKKYI